MARGRTSIGNTAGGRGRLPNGMTSQAEYYRSGRASAFNPGATVRDANGSVVSGTVRGTGTGKS